MASSPNFDEPDRDELGTEQPFVSHLVELRDRMIRMIVAVFAVFLGLLPFANEIYVYVATPLMKRLPEGTSMIATQVTGPFLAPLKTALVAAVFLAMPYLLYQVWAFVAPGLYRHEKRLAVPLLVSSIVLFYLGVVFAYYLVFPLIFAFLTGTAPEGVAVMTDISAYLEFVLTLFFAFGIAFEIPIAIILLVLAGVATPDDLVRVRPYVIVGVFVVGMLLTPPDVISQTLLAVPMWFLYEFGVLFARFAKRQGGASDPGRDAPYGGNPGPAGPRPADPGPGSATPSPGPRSAPQAGLLPSRKSGGDAGFVGRELGGGDPFDPQRFRPMTPDEMEAELDAIEAHATAEGPDLDSVDLDEPDSVASKLERIKVLREREDYKGARTLLYEVLESGDEDQRHVARNVLAQMDSPEGTVRG